MTSDEATVAIIKALDATGVPFMIVGSLSSNFYGVARATHNADFVVELGESSLARVTDLVGPELVLDPQITFESVTGTTRYQFQLLDHDFKIEVFVTLQTSATRPVFERILQLCPACDPRFPARNAGRCKRLKCYQFFSSAVTRTTGNVSPGACPPTFTASRLSCRRRRTWSL